MGDLSPQNENPSADVLIREGRTVPTMDGKSCHRRVSLAEFDPDSRTGPWAPPRRFCLRYESDLKHLGSSCCGSRIGPQIGRCDYADVPARVKRNQPSVS